MPNHSRLALALILACGTPALADTAGDMDANGDGVLTIDEVQAVYPQVGSENFIAMDLNADGALDAEEVAAAQDAGLMPVADG